MQTHSRSKLAGLCICWFVAALFISVLPLQASAIDAPAHITATIPNARLLGGGSFRYFGFHIYDAQLWVGGDGYKPDEAFAIDLNYARNFDGAEIAKTSREEMERMQYGTPTQQAQWFTQMKAIFPDVHKGQHITGVFLPKGDAKGEGAGVKFFLDGRPIGSVNDAEFARAFAAIWLDPRTKADKVRGQMLGLSRQGLEK